MSLNLPADRALPWQRSEGDTVSVTRTRAAVATIVCHDHLLHSSPQDEPLHHKRTRVSSVETCCKERINVTQQENSLN